MAGTSHDWKREDDDEEADQELDETVRRTNRAPHMHRTTFTDAHFIELQGPKGCRYHGD